MAIWHQNGRKLLLCRLKNGQLRINRIKAGVCTRWELVSSQSVQAVQAIRNRRIRISPLSQIAGAEVTSGKAKLLADPPKRTRVAAVGFEPQSGKVLEPCICVPSPLAFVKSKAACRRTALHSCRFVDHGAGS